jgi:hypothetical protein
LDEPSGALDNQNKEQMQQFDKLAIKLCLKSYSCHLSSKALASTLQFLGASQVNKYIYKNPESCNFGW